MRIGSFELANSVFVAPMAGVTDRPFRMLCKQLGAGYAVSEMVTSRPDLFKSLKTSRRVDHTGESGPIAVQIAGTDAPMMADAARYKSHTVHKSSTSIWAALPKKFVTNGRALL